MIFFSVPLNVVSACKVEESFVKKIPRRSAIQRLVRNHQDLVRVIEHVADNGLSVLGLRFVSL